MGDGGGDDGEADAAASAGTGTGPGDGEPTPTVSAPASSEPSGPAPADEFGVGGWALVGLLVVAFVLIPGAILYLPAAEGFIESLGLSLRDAYLTLPLIPAFLLGGAAVWVAVRSRAN